MVFCLLLLAISIVKDVGPCFFGKNREVICQQRMSMIFAIEDERDIPDVRLTRADSGIQLFE